MSEKKHNFRYSTPIKPKPIVLFKRSIQNINNQDDISLQISKALNCSLSNSDTMDNTIELVNSHESSNTINVQNAKIDSKKSYEDFLESNNKIKELDKISKDTSDTKIKKIEPLNDRRKTDNLKKTRNKQMSFKKFKKQVVLNLDCFYNKFRTLNFQNKRLIAENDKLNSELDELRTKKSEILNNQIEIKKERDVLKNENINLIKLHEDYKLGIGSTIDILKENLNRINLERTNLQDKNVSLKDKYNEQKLFLVKELNHLDYIISTLDIDHCIKIYKRYLENRILDKNNITIHEICNIVDQVDTEILGISNIFKDISLVINIERSKIIFEIEKCVVNISEMKNDFIELKDTLNYKEMKIRKLKKKYRRYKYKLINKSKSKKETINKSTISDTDIWDCFK